MTEKWRYLSFKRLTCDLLLQESWRESHGGSSKKRATLISGTVAFRHIYPTKEVLECSVLTEIVLLALPQLRKTDFALMTVRSIWRNQLLQNALLYSTIMKKHRKSCLSSLCFVCRDRSAKLSFKSCRTTCCFSGPQLKRFERNPGYIHYFLICQRLQRKFARFSPPKPSAEAVLTVDDWTAVDTEVKTNTHFAGNTV